MTEAEARSWIEQRYGPDRTAMLANFARMVAEENGRQNLIAPSTVSAMWNRHLLDSAQLVPMAQDGLWIDIGSGAGFPGLVAAILSDQPLLLVEPRRQRAAFLEECVKLIGLQNAEVRGVKVEAMATPACVISARAVGSVEKLLQAAAACGTKETRWLLPRGRFDEVELQSLKQRWRGVFHMKQSLTDPKSTILVCDGPERR